MILLIVILTILAWLTISVLFAKLLRSIDTCDDQEEALFLGLVWPISIPCLFVTWIFITLAELI